MNDAELLHRGRRAEGSHEGLRVDGTHDGMRVTHEGLRGHAPANGFETPSSRALRIALARAFPVRIAPMREALVSGSITKLARP